MFGYQNAKKSALITERFDNQTNSLDIRTKCFGYRGRLFGYRGTKMLGYQCKLNASITKHFGALITEQKICSVIEVLLYKSLYSKTKK